MAALIPPRSSSRSSASAAGPAQPPEASGPDVVAAGAVVVRKGPAGREVLLVHRPKYDDWSLPKGKPVPDEHLLETAVREVAEETGFSTAVGRRGVRTCYTVPEGDKQDDYWLMRVTGGTFAPNDEVDELRWLPVDDAAELVSHDHDRDVLADLARTDVPRFAIVLPVVSPRFFQWEA